MRTTLDLDDDLLRAVQLAAVASGRTVTDVISETLRRVFAGASEPTRPYRLRWTTVRGRRRPELDLDDRDSLFELMEDRGR